MFYAQVELHQGLPFSVNIPNPETIEAMKEGENPDRLPAYKRFSDLRKEKSGLGHTVRLIEYESGWVGKTQPIYSFQ